MTRIFLDEYPMPPDPPVGLGILQLVSAPESEVQNLVERLRHKAEHEIHDSEMSKRVIELVEELLLRRFTQFDREEVRKLFQLQDIRKSKVWQEAHETGIEKGRAETVLGLVRNFLVKGMSIKEIAELLNLSLKEVRKFAKNGAK